MCVYIYIYIHTHLSLCIIIIYIYICLAGPGVRLLVRRADVEHGVRGDVLRYVISYDSIVVYYSIVNHITVYCMLYNMYHILSYIISCIIL